jgi:hypothetical protein
MADTPKERLKKRQIDIDHWRRMGEEMTPVQIFDIASQAVQTVPGNKTLHRSQKAKPTKYKKGGLVKGGKGRKRII